MKFKFRRFLQANTGGEGGEPTPDQNPNPTPNPNPQGGNGGEGSQGDNNALFTKLDEIITKRTNGLVKSILKEQGVDGDELKDLVSAYNTNKQNKAKEQIENKTKLRNENTQLKEQLSDMKFQGEVNKLASELEFSQDADKYLSKLINKNEYLDDKGEIKVDDLKKGMEQVLKDFPALKKVEGQKGLHYVGGQGNGGKDPQNDDLLRKAFGLSVKKD